MNLIIGCVCDECRRKLVCRSPSTRTRTVCWRRSGPEASARTASSSPCLHRTLTFTTAPSERLHSIARTPLYIVNVRVGVMLTAASFPDPTSEGVRYRFKAPPSVHDGEGGEARPPSTPRRRPVSTRARDDPHALPPSVHASCVKLPLAAGNPTSNK